jgi:hypothetical protein
VVAVTLQGADPGDMATLDETLSEAGMAVTELVGREAETAGHEAEGERQRDRRVGCGQGVAQPVCRLTSPALMADCPGASETQPAAIAPTRRPGSCKAPLEPAAHPAGPCTSPSSVER